MAKQLKKNLNSGGKVSSHMVFVWSADFSRVDGQSIITQCFINTFLPRISGLYLYKIGWRGILGVFFLYLNVYRSLFLRSQGISRRILYLVVSRSVLGFLRDLPVLLVVFFKVDLLLHVHGSDVVELFENPITGRIAQIIYSKATIVVPSEHLIIELGRYGLKDVHVIENILV